MQSEDEGIRFGGLRFDPQFLSARKDGGEEIAFTRAERQLLEKLSANPGVLLSRDRLLDAVSGEGSDATDRSIDFLVSKLRRKLGDSARDPQYIATRYGEGYVWMASRAAAKSAASGAFLVVGPVLGLSGTGAADEVGRRFAECVVEQLERNTAPQSDVVFDPQCPPAKEFAGVRPRFQLMLAFLVRRELRLDCAVTLREFASGHILAVQRRTLHDNESATLESVSAMLARELIDSAWQVLAKGEKGREGPDVPLAVRLHEAAESLNELRNNQGWQSSEARLRQLLARRADDPEARLMLATTLHSKHVSSGIDMLTWGDPRRADEAEIEQLVTPVLPQLQSNGILAIAAAKLLYFINESYRPLALDLAEEALACTTAFANAYTLGAQLRMWHGRLDEALDMYDRALDFADSGSHFQYYILTLKAQVLEAQGRFAAAADTVAPICRVAPPAAKHYGLFYRLPSDVDPQGRIEAELAAMPPERARAVLVYKHYICARLFAHAEHRRNLMRYVVEQMVRRFGRRIIPEEIERDLPPELRAAAG